MAGTALIEEAREQLARRRPVCTEGFCRKRIQTGVDVGNPEVVRLWRCVLARVVEAQVRS